MSQCRAWSDPGKSVTVVSFVPFVGRDRRAHKRHLANRIIRRMWRDETARKQPQLLAA